MCALLLISGKVLDNAQGFPDRLNAEARAAYEAAFAAQGYREPCEKLDDLGALPHCANRSGQSVPDLIVWGDSHSRAIVPAIADLSDQYRITYARYHCLPLLDVYNTARAADLTSSSCYASNRHLLDYLKAYPVKAVLLVGAWSASVEGRELRMEGAGQRDGFYGDSLTAPYAAEVAREVFRRALPITVNEIRATGAEVWIMKQVPQFRYWVANELAKALTYGNDPNTLARSLIEHMERQRYVDAVIDNVATRDPRVHVIDPAELLCAEQKCVATRDGEALYFDYHHLSLRGAEELKPLFSFLIRSLERPASLLQ
jgi:hypothetical protein